MLASKAHYFTSDDTPILADCIVVVQISEGQISQKNPGAVVL